MSAAPTFALDRFHQGPNPRAAPDGRWHVWNNRTAEHAGAFATIGEAKAEARRLNRERAP